MGCRLIFGAILFTAAYTVHLSIKGNLSVTDKREELQLQRMSALGGEITEQEEGGRKDINM